jgi:hypothetical protein
MASAQLHNEAGGAEWLRSLADLLCEEYLCFEALLVLFLEEEELIQSRSTALLGEVQRKKQNILRSICLLESQIQSLRRRWNETGRPHGLCGAAVAEYATRNRGILSRIVAVGEKLAPR